MTEPTFDRKIFKYRLATLIAESGKTRKEVAEELGINYSTFSNYFQRHNNIPTKKVLKHIAEHFGVSVGYLKGKEVTAKEEKSDDESNRQRKRNYYFV